MKRVLYIALCFFSWPAAAQTSEYFYVKLHSGVTVPYGPDQYAAEFEPGPGFGLSLAYGISPGLEFAVSGAYTFLNVDGSAFLANRSFPEDPSFDPGRPRYYGASAETRWYVGGEFWAVYLMGGAGVRRLHLPDRQTAGTSGLVSVPGVSYSGPALSGGFGLMIPASSRFGFFGEVNYEVLFSEDERLRTIPFKAGIVIQLSDSF